MARGLAKQKLIFTAQGLSGGENDTINPESRAPSQFKSMRNIRLEPQGYFCKSKGRQLIKKASSEIVAEFIPPEPNPIIEISSLNCTLKFVYNGSYYTATLASGKYYEHSELATALQNALNSAVGSGSPFSVSYNSSSYKYSITADASFVLKWYVDDTTLPANIFGFRYSIASSGTPPSASSEWRVDCPPPYNRFFVTADGKFYKLSNDGQTLTQITALADETSLSYIRFTGVSHQKRLYFSTGIRSYILNNNHHFTRLSSKYGEVIAQGTQTNGTSAVYFYDVSNETGVTGWEVNVKEFRIRGVSPSHVPGEDTVYGLSKIRLYFKNASVRPNWVMDVYVEYKDDSAITYINKTSNRQVFVKRLVGKDYTTSYNWVDIEVRPFLGISDYLSRPIDIVFKIVGGYNAGNTGLIIGTRASTSGGESPYECLDDNGCWVQASAYILARIVASSPDATGSGDCKHKISFVNSEGYEFPLSDALTKFSNPSCNNFEFGFAFKGYPGVIDDYFHWEWIYVYRTPCGDDNYYLVAKIPREAVFTYSNSTERYIRFIEGMSDSDLIAQPVSDNSDRTTLPAHILSCWWDNKLFFVCPDQRNVVFWSYDGQPEKISLAYKWDMPSAQSAEITALCPLEDRLLIFCRNNIFSLVKSGDSYVQAELGIKGIGTVSPASVVPVLSSEGAGVFFQSQLGDFYITDGSVLQNISKGLKDELIKTLNLNRLDKTCGIHHPTNKEIIWMISTGTNDYQDTALIFNYNFKHWRTETMSANVLEIDQRNDYYPNKLLIIGGDKNGNIFYLNNSDNDLGQNISWELETADFDFAWGGLHPEHRKAFLNLEFKADGETGQTINVKWYLDGRSTENYTGGKHLSCTGSLDSFKTALNGSGKTLRLKFTGTDSLGEIKIYPWRIEFQPYAQARL